MAVTAPEPTRSDTQIKRDVLQELRWDPRVTDTDVGVQVRGGIVTLTGCVDSYARKVAAKDAAHRVAGVQDVADDLIVRLPREGERTDAEIARAVRHALEWTASVPDTRITTTVTNGWVTLEGSVERLFEKEDADTAVRRLVGVVGVSNDVLVETPEADCAEVRRSIEDALARQAHREVERLRIEVEGGVLKISGVVRSWPERRAVLNVASCAPGVRAVEEHLRVEPRG